MDIKRGDARTLRWKASADLTGATVRFIASKKDATEPTFDKTAIVEEVADGSTVLAVDFTTADTADTANLRVEFEASLSDVVQTFPTNGYGSLYIRADLG